MLDRTRPRSLPSLAWSALNCSISLQIPSVMSLSLVPSPLPVGLGRTRRRRAGAAAGSLAMFAILSPVALADIALQRYERLQSRERSLLEKLVARTVLFVLTSVSEHPERRGLRRRMVRSESAAIDLSPALRCVDAPAGRPHHSSAPWPPAIRRQGRRQCRAIGHA